MGLNFPGVWRFDPPPDGHFVNKSIPVGAVGDFMEVIEKIPANVSRKGKLEHFKGYFGGHYPSSDEGWAFTDLSNAMSHAADNAPLFIESYFDACEALRRLPGSGYVPDFTLLNVILNRHNVGYEIRPPDLVAKEIGGLQIPVPIPPPTLVEHARSVLDRSLSRSEQLLSEGRPREAVQESLWLLETVATAFRDLGTKSGKVEGKYFNQIVRDLRSKRTGTTTEQVLTWITAMHGYLSSPTGGGVRHGVDLSTGVDLDLNQARLFCNLIRSYISFLLVEHDALVRAGS
jgi:hypothetical protein